MAEVKEEMKSKFYPKAKYHAKSAPVLVHSKEEEKELGDEWKDNPSEFGIITAPSNDQKGLQPLDDEHRKLMGTPNAVFAAKPVPKPVKP